MCESGTCRPCRIEDRELDRAMGATRVYVDYVKLPSREDNIENRRVAGLSLISSGFPISKREPIKGPPPLEGSLSSKENISARKKRATAERKANRELRDGRLYSLGCQEHGTATGYTHWYCRCIPCTNANTARKFEQYQGKRA